MVGFLVVQTDVQKHDKGVTIREENSIVTITWSLILFHSWNIKKPIFFFLRYVLGYIDKLLKHGVIVNGERYVQGCVIVFMVFAVLLLWWWWWWCYCYCWCGLVIYAKYARNLSCLFDHCSVSILCISHTCGSVCCFWQIVRKFFTSCLLLVYY